MVMINVGDGDGDGVVVVVAVAVRNWGIIRWALCSCRFAIVSSGYVLVRQLKK